ncbi:hypothetical protein HUG10_21445 (plasmid) [Halorarum halophilum]|uniref:Uncharacterized protein n=1 Tax=Halorarum halophilum TaxID=2743090 RepID=A0A7D5KPD7_9EURY|nr:hypothetical protein [Halobaculum halophilum]QLG30155.1 hypothetical protein HUG10_21445 [Halobaculum halophilum]
MEREGPDTYDEPGHDRATGIDDPVTDAEYGDQGYRPEDDIDPSEGDPFEYSMEDEYAVDADEFGPGNENYGTYCADDHEHAARQAQDEHPDEDLSSVYVTHVETGEAKRVELGSSDEDDGMLGDEFVENLEQNAEDPLLELLDEAPESNVTLTTCEAYMEAHDDQWTLLSVTDEGDSLFYLRDTEQAFSNVLNAARALAEYNQYPKERVGIVTVTLAVPYLQARNDEREDEESIVRSTVIDQLDGGVHPSIVTDFSIVERVDGVEFDAEDIEGNSFDVRTALDAIHRSPEPSGAGGDGPSLAPEPQDSVPDMLDIVTWHDGSSARKGEVVSIDLDGGEPTVMVDDYYTKASDRVLVSDIEDIETPEYKETPDHEVFN